MGESEDPKTAAIPGWQRQAQKSPPTVDETQPQKSSPSLTGESLLEQARKFLDDDSIRGASRERKVTFLQKKGLQPDDIQKLLGPESDTTSPPESEPELKTIHDSTQTPPAETEHTEPKASSPTPAQDVVSATPNRDVPPIITYPEFLLRQQKPPPVVTFQRLAYAAYGIAGISTLTYGASKYLVEPMLEALNCARHELAETALRDLEKFNSKLEASVSHVPYVPSSALLKQKSSAAGRGVEDDISIDSDPTELFHRDIAVQTSPPCSRSSSLSASVSDTSVSQPVKDQTTHQAARLASLRSSLSSILPPIRSESTSSLSSDITHPTETSAPSLQSALTDLQSMLDTMQFQNQFAPASAYNDIYGDGRDTRKMNKGKSGADAKEDEAVKFKTEIRALKGLLLSSRNFPTGRLATTTQVQAGGGLLGIR